MPELVLACQLIMSNQPGRFQLVFSIWWTHALVRTCHVAQVFLRMGRRKLADPVVHTAVDGCP
jgi:hypothetical protein